MVVETDWLIGVGLMFGLAFVFNYLTFEDLIGFFAWLTIFSGFVVWGGLLPLWVLYLNIIILVLIMYFSMRERGLV